MPLAAAYGLLNLAAFVRALLPLIWPAGYFACRVVSGALWSVAFALFVWVYAPILLAPRLRPAMMGR